MLNITSSQPDVDDNQWGWNESATTNDASIELQLAGNSRRDRPVFKLDRRNPPNLNQQLNPDPALMVISQPPGIPLAAINSYAYQTEAVGKVMVYIVDTGLDPSMPVRSSRIFCKNATSHANQTTKGPQLWPCELDISWLCS